ncbi:MAG: phosphoribosylformylglycinamidine synthase, partial [Deltaproteobacteria bacterium]|nr:phosphoribosylformylglycinamidine synthase [Deltaproteobacteria bacterium]
MVHRIEIGFKQDIRDALGEKMRKKIVEHFGIHVEEVKTAEVYTIEGALTGDDLEKIASGPFSDPAIQRYAVDRGIAESFDWLIEVGFKPGVTDNVGRTATEAVKLLLERNGGIQVFTSRQYLLTGSLTRADADRIASGLLANELIQRFEIIDGKDWDPEKGIQAYVPHVVIEDNTEIEKIDLNIDDEGLQTISNERVLALTVDEMKVIRDHFNDESIIEERRKVGMDAQITDAEMECLAQTWSEHCKHKIFNSIITYEDEAGKAEVIDSLFDSCIKASTRKIREDLGEEDWCLSVFVDNAGVIKFNESFNLVFKVETHNSPSALDPYGGALTGIVGVNRDPFGTGQGSKLIFNTDIFCFASPFHSEELPKRILHPRRIYEGVREGVEHGGNKSGIPTVNGCIVFDERYLGKPLVYCGTGGIMPSVINGKSTHSKEILPGDVIIMTGGRIGKDGIHGATFSSEELHEGSPVTAVQIGDPITQK